MYGRTAELIVLIGFAASGTYADCEEDGKQLDKGSSKNPLCQRPSYLPLRGEVDLNVFSTWVLGVYRRRAGRILQSGSLAFGVAWFSQPGGHQKQ